MNNTNSTSNEFLSIKRSFISTRLEAEYLAYAYEALYPLFQCEKINEQRFISNNNKELFKTNTKIRIGA